MPPKISVIVPTFNRCELIRNAIQSILAQSFQDLEIIVIDDGSTDGTGQLLASYNYPKIRYFYQENQGLPAAWNRGIEKSTGELIALLDSDDYWLDGKLQAQVDFLERMPYHGCVTGYYLHKLNGKKKPIIPLPVDTNLRAILWKNILHLGTTFMGRRTVFEKVGLFDESLRRGQDTDWLIRYRKMYEVGIVSQPLAVFNQHLSRSGKVMEESHLFFLEKHRAILLEQGAIFYRQKAATIYTDLAYQFYRENDLAKARQYAHKALSLFPILWPGLYLILLDVHLGFHFKRRLDAIKYPKIFK